jgi:hypothetical protein
MRFLILWHFHNTTPTDGICGVMQDGYVDRFDQKISPHPSFPKRGVTNFPLWKRGNKGDFVNCRSSIKLSRTQGLSQVNLVRRKY